MSKPKELTQEQAVIVQAAATLMSGTNPSTMNSVPESVARAILIAEDVKSRTAKS